MKKIIYTILMFMPLALFTSCYDDIESTREIIYDIDVYHHNHIARDSSGNALTGGTIMPDFSLYMFIMDKNGTNIVEKLLTPEYNMNAGKDILPTYCIQRTPEYYINGQFIDYKKYRDNDSSDSLWDYLRIIKVTDHYTINPITEYFYLYLEKFTALNYHKCKEWKIEVRTILPEIFNDEDSHSLKFTLMVGNTYEYYQEIVPAEKWVHSAMKNITLDNEPLEINYLENMNLYEAKGLVH